MAGEEGSSGADDFDMAGALDEVASGLGKELPTEDPPEGDDSSAAVGDDAEVAKVASPAASKPSVVPAAAAAPVEVKAPVSWKPEAQAEFAKAPPAVQAEVMRREADMAKFVGEKGPYIKVGEGAEKFLMGQKDLCDHFKINPWDKTAELWGMFRSFSTANPQQKLQQLVDFAARNGLNLQLQGATEVDPAFRQLREENEATRRELQQFGQQAYNEKLAKSEQEVESFIASGEAPYFGEVSQEMLHLLNTGRRKTVKEAYDEAVWMNPVTRLKEQQRITADAANKSTVEARKRADAARNSSRVNVKSTPARGRPGPPPKSIDDTLNATMDDILSRAD